VQNYDSCLNFATDAWTSPNHHLFIAVTMHIEKNGAPVCMLLDIIKLLVLHSRINLATVFVKILCSYGIEHKVSFINSPTVYILTFCQLLSVTCNNTDGWLIMSTGDSLGFATMLITTCIFLK
jgi:hypothetical protein